ncbi:MAG: NAD-dependent epimerase/dehydratase family protein, partial [Minisyncoccia bacterium]
MTKGKLLVTGSSGFIGSHVVEEALKNGYYVRGLDLKENNNAAIDFVRGDIRDNASVAKAIEDVD